MTTEQKKEVVKMLTDDVGRSPVVVAMLRAVLSASVFAGLNRNELTDAQAVEYAGDIADRILEQNEIE